jgi:hypothetical protein
MTPGEALLAMRQCEPDALAMITIDRFIVGGRIRRDVRAAIRAAEVRGASVMWGEERGWIDSVFYLRMSGTVDQICPMLQVFFSLAKGSRP